VHGRSGIPSITDLHDLQHRGTSLAVPNPENACPPHPIMLHLRICPTFMVVSALIKVPLESDRVQALEPEFLVLLDGAPVH
jgi:hypothetical protein